MTADLAAYIRSLRDASLRDFELRLLSQFANARRQFREARENLDEQRECLRLIQAVKKERALGNVVEFPTKVETERPAKKRRA